MKLRAKSTICALATATIALVLCLPAFAQLNLGRIFGGVMDTSGGAVVGATVRVVDVQRGITRPLTTDSAGEYSAPSLTPGTYTVTAEAKGFKTIQRENVVVGVGADIRVDLTLEPGEQTQTVTVTGEIPQVDTTNAQLQQTIETTDVADLPIQGRQYRNLILFNPAVASTPGSGTPRYTIYNGIHAGANIWMFDGLFAMSPFINSPEIGGQQANAGPDQATILPVDAIQEINTIGEPKAEYGWAPGMQVNVGLKSGTNDVHGTAFALGRDSALNAKNQFLLPTQSKPPYAMEQFGGAIGGPIKKDKVFYFASYEGQRLAVGIPVTALEPTSAVVTGASGPTTSLPVAIAALNGDHVAASQLSLNLAGCTNNGSTVAANITCNAAAGVFGNSNPTSSETVAPIDQGGSDNGIIKVDYHINDKNSVNGEYYTGQSSFFFPAAGGGQIQPYWRSLNPNAVDVVRAVWLWTPNANWVNEARFGFDKSENNAYDGSCKQNVGQPNYASQFGFVPGIPAIPLLGGANCGFPVVTIGTFTGLGDPTTPAIDDYWRPEGSDAVSYTHGKHLFKFGFETRYTQFSGQHSSGVLGSINFGTGAASNNDPAIPGATALEDFLAGYSDTQGAGALLVGSAYRVLDVPAYAAFIQDDWRLSSRITINLGLRWEANPAFTAQNNLVGNFNPSKPFGIFQQTTGHPVINGDDDAFGPRLGMAWDVTGKGTTVVRAGGSILSGASLQDISLILNGVIPTGFNLYAASGACVAGTAVGCAQTPPGNIATGSKSFNNSNLAWTANTPIFGAVSTALSCGNGLSGNPTPCSLTVTNPNFRVAYVTSWNLTVQHAFTNNISLNIAYVGNHGTHLPDEYDLNQPAPGTSGAENELVRRPFYNAFPYLSSITYLTNDSESNYNGLQATLSQRLTHGLSYTAGYTFSHSIDQNSDDTAGDVMDALQPHLDYGSSEFDIRNHFALTASYAVPGLKSPGQLLQGWNLNTTVTAQSGLPVLADDTTDDISGTGINLDRWDLFGSPSNFKLGGASPVPCYGVTGSKFASNGCTAGALPAPCIADAAQVPTGPTGQTGMAALLAYGCYMEGNGVILPPTQGTYGTMGRDVLRNLPFHTWDFSLSKDTKIRERYTIEFRADFFNVLNQPHYASVGNGQGSANLAAPGQTGHFGQALSTPDAGQAGNPVIGNGGPRDIQFGLKLIF